jgi:sec-independent protein translocase protein TatA
MGSFSMMHWLIVLVVILIIFGAGKLPRVMGDLAKGIKNFQAGMKADPEGPAGPPAATSAREEDSSKA